MLDDNQIVLKIEEKKREKREYQEKLKIQLRRKKEEDEIRRKKEEKEDAKKKAEESRRREKEEQRRRREKEQEDKKRERDEKIRREQEQKYRDFMNECVPILNQELEMLCLEFQIQEVQIDAPEQFSENIDVNKEYCGCCCCQTNGNVEIKELRVRSVDLREFFHVKNAEDAEIKRDELRKRYEQLHSFGWRRCQNLNGQCTSHCCYCFGYCIGMSIIPTLCCSYAIYNCYSCLHNMKYRTASRTKKILQVYEKIEKYSNLSRLQAENKIKVQKLRNVLSEIIKKREQILNRNTDQIEILNLELETLEAEFKLGDVKEEEYTQNLVINRNEQCGCCTSLPKGFRSVPCDVQSLKSHFKVEDEQEFYKKLKNLQQMDQDLGMCKCYYCICFTSMSITPFSNSSNSQIGQNFQSEQNRKNAFNNVWLFGLPLCGLPFALMCPILSAYNCCEFCCDYCYRRSSRIHRLFKTYDSYRGSIIRRPPS